MADKKQQADAAKQEQQRKANAQWRQAQKDIKRHDREFDKQHGKGRGK